MNGQFFKLLCCVVMAVLIQDTAFVSCGLSITRGDSDVLLIDIAADPVVWDEAVSGLTSQIAYDFNLDPDYGLQAFSGPLTSAGGSPPTPGPVSAGVLSDNVIIRSETSGIVADDLTAVGPFSIYGNPLNAVLTRTLPDYFEIELVDPVIAVEVNLVFLPILFMPDEMRIEVLEAEPPGMTVFDPVENNGMLGKRFGIIANASQIERIKIQISIVNDALGFPGVQGTGIVYSETQGMLGDVNQDGAVNLLDVDPFVGLLSSGGYLFEADINGDGTVNLLDVDPFVALLSGG